MRRKNATERKNGTKNVTLIRGWRVWRLSPNSPGGRVVKDDTIFFGFVQGLEEEWGYFSLVELESLKPELWEIPKKNLPYSGRRH